MDIQKLDDIREALWKLITEEKNLEKKIALMNIKDKVVELVIFSK